MKSNWCTLDLLLVESAKKHFRSLVNSVGAQASPTISLFYMSPLATILNLTFSKIPSDWIFSLYTSVHAITGSPFSGSSIRKVWLLIKFLISFKVAAKQAILISSGYFGTAAKFLASGIKCDNTLPCVASTTTSTYLLLALVKGRYRVPRCWSDSTGEGGRGGKQGRREAGSCAREGERAGRAGSGSGRQEEGHAGGQAEKISGPLGGDVPVYRTDRRRRGGRMDADPFQDLQYPKRTERQICISVERDESGECGCRGLPRDQIYGGDLHAETFRL